MKKFVFLVVSVAFLIGACQVFTAICLNIPLLTNPQNRHQIRYDSIHTVVLNSGRNSKTLVFGEDVKNGKPASVGLLSICSTFKNQDCDSIRCEIENKGMLITTSFNFSGRAVIVENTKDYEIIAREKKTAMFFLYFMLPAVLWFVFFIAKKAFSVSLIITLISLTTNLFCQKSESAILESSGFYSVESKIIDATIYTYPKGFEIRREEILLSNVDFTHPESVLFAMISSNNGGTSNVRLAL